MTRRRVRWRRTARSDLLNIARWIAHDDPDAAHRFLDAAREAADMLADLPKLGPGGRFRSRGLNRIRVWPIRGFDKILMIYAPERSGIAMCCASFTEHETWTPSSSTAGNESRA